MSDETPGKAGGEGEEPSKLADDKTDGATQKQSAAAPAPEGIDMEEAAQQDTSEEPAGSLAEEAPEPPTTPAAPQPAPAPEHGQRRITRHTTTSTTRTETTTDETIVETVTVAPPVWAAPAGEHPRPVG